MQDPSDPENRDKQDWELVDDAVSPDWKWKSIDSEEGWVSRTFSCRIAYREGYEFGEQVKLYMIADTGESLLFVERVVLAVAESDS